MQTAWVWAIASAVRPRHAMSFVGSATIASQSTIQSSSVDYQQLNRPWNDLLRQKDYQTALTMFLCSGRQFPSAIVPPWPRQTRRERDDDNSSFKVEKPR
ncbi:hypothetical protein N657DRAFT_248227 [Parathielavia appendiculata]|uniref:Uncharacterized protein n=1 Tax=Parathielavia appendiculata TaxID=2587402 RepID=A0AAN6Z0R1_9PEZI|nr:hypothetical protein N657DRAFT_248227 [Parathielavia appendiculata]